MERREGFYMNHTVTTGIAVAILLLSACSAPVAVPTATPVPTATLAPAFGSYQEWLAEFDYNAQTPLNIMEVGVEGRDDITIHDITFDSPVEGKIPAYLVTPGRDGPFPAILYVHWYGGDKSNRREFLDEAVGLAKEGVVSLLVDEMFAAPFARHKWTGRDAQADRRLIIQQVIELRRAVDVLLAQPNVDPGRIGYVGHDFGAVFGGVLAGVDFRIKTFVLMTPTPDFSDWFLLDSSTSVSMVDREAYRRLLLTVAPINYIGHAKTSLFFQMAKNDGFVSEAAALSLFNAAPEPKRIEWYKGSEGHFLQRNLNATQDRLIWLGTELNFTVTGQ
jgi:cephalosporin-C deacetylase-like acetyl esterase